VGCEREGWWSIFLPEGRSKEGCRVRRLWRRLSWLSALHSREVLNWRWGWGA